MYGGKKSKFALRNVPVRVIPQSEGELERRLSEGIEPDDQFGCDLLDINWRELRENAPAPDYDALGLCPEGDDDICPEAPPPAYTI